MGPGRGHHRGRSAMAGPRRSAKQPHAQALPCAGCRGPTCMRQTHTNVPAAAYLGGSHGHQVHPGVGFAQHVMATRGIGEDLHAVQAHVHVWAVGGGVGEKRLVSPARPPSPTAPGVSSLPWAETPGGQEKRSVSPARPPSPAAPGVSSLHRAETQDSCKPPAPQGPQGWGSGGRADLWGVQSSSQTSLPIQVSHVERTASPKGTVSWGAVTRAREAPWLSCLGHVLSQDSTGHTRDSQEGCHFVSSPNEYPPPPAGSTPSPGPAGVSSADRRAPATPFTRPRTQL